MTFKVFYTSGREEEGAELSGAGSSGLCVCGIIYCMWTDNGQRADCPSQTRG